MHFTGAILMEDRIFRVPHPGWLAQLQNSSESIDLLVCATTKADSGCLPV